jgi:hypothetical protein
MRFAACAVALAILLSGCAPTTPADLPEGVTVSVFQTRFDYGIRQLELKVSNATNEPLTITRAALDSNRFASEAVWDRPQTVPAGAARDLKVLLAVPVCDGAAPTDIVALEFTLSSGESGSARVIPSDEGGRLDAISAEDCLSVSVAHHVALNPPATVEWMPGAHAPATLNFSVEPTTAAGSLTVHFVSGTVLLSLVDPLGQPVYQQDLELRFDASTPASVIPLRVIPGRCDPHAIAEDKRGTFFAFEVSTSDNTAGRLFVGVSDDVRATLYEFYADYCDLP